MSIIYHTYNWLLILTYRLRAFLGLRTKFSGKVTFSSDSFDRLDTYDFRELQWGGLRGWNPQLPWYDENTHQSWNDYNTAGIFTQTYGTFIFKTKLWQPVTKSSWPAIWLLDIKKDLRYLEIDIELMEVKDKVRLCFATHIRYCPGEIKHFRSGTSNRFLIRKLQSQENTYTIDWNAKRVKWYLNDVLIAYTTNIPRDEMFIVLTKIDKCKVTVLNN